MAFDPWYGINNDSAESINEYMQRELIRRQQQMMNQAVGATAQRAAQKAPSPLSATTGGTVADQQPEKPSYMNKQLLLTKRGRK